MGTQLGVTGLEPKRINLKNQGNKSKQHTNMVITKDYGYLNLYLNNVLQVYYTIK